MYCGKTTTASLSPTLTAKKVSTTAPKSNKECAASDKIPILPVANPTTSLSKVNIKLANTELKATDCFLFITNSVYKL